MLSRKPEHPVLSEYSSAAREYDDRWAFYVDATTRETLKRLRLRGNEHLLDVGCGTGELLMRVRARYPEARLAGIDPVSEMLEVARGKIHPTGTDLRVGWADELPWGDETFDVVVSCNMFHYVDHPLQALREAFRVLRPRGTFVLTDWCDDYIACRLCGWYLRITGSALHKVYTAAQCSAMLRTAGFAPEIEKYKISRLWGLMTAVATKQRPPGG
jgi:ubiquinone/menaquinone biosynthesis C-methylase UbiE